MKNFFLILSLILLCYACDRKQSAPKGILPKEKMISIMIDMHIAESQVTALNLKRDSARIIFDHIEQTVFDKHQVDESVYVKSFDYYIYNVNEMESIYDAVIDSLTLRERLSVIN